MQAITYNNLVDLFKQFADNHQQIKRFGSGAIRDIDNLMSKEPTFPICWAYLNDISYPAFNVKNYNFYILIFTT